MSNWLRSKGAETYSLLRLKIDKTKEQQENYWPNLSASTELQRFSLFRQKKNYTQWLQSFKYNYETPVSIQPNWAEKYNKTALTIFWGMPLKPPKHICGHRGLGLSALTSALWISLQKILVFVSTTLWIESGHHIRLASPTWLDTMKPNNLLLGD